MSSSRQYYKSSSSSRDALPPIRDVLGDELDYPTHRDSAYSFDAVGRALPDASSSSRTRSTWPQTTGTTLPPIHHSRTQGGYASAGPATPAYTSSSSSHHSSQPSSRSAHAQHASHASQAPQSHGQHPPAPYSFDVFRPSSSGLVHASSSSQSQGILRTTRADAGRRHGSSSHAHGEDGDDGEDDEGSKRYVCDRCGKRFGRPSSLKTHEVVHSDDKPYECTYPGCGKTFTVASNMRRHYRKTHEAAASFSRGGGSGSGDEDEEYGGGYGGGYGSSYGGGGGYGASYGGGQSSSSRVYSSSSGRR